MATTTVSDAVVVPQAKGTGLGSEDDNVDAAAAALLSKYQGGEYTPGGFANGLQFTSHDASGDNVDIDTGACFIVDDSSSSSNSRGTDGNAQIQSTSSSGYDTEIPGNQVYLVIFPTTTTISVSDSTLNQIWVNITDVTSNNSVEIRSDGGGGTTAAPSDTFIKLGESNPDDSSADTRDDKLWHPIHTTELFDGASGSTSNSTYTTVGGSANTYTVAINLYDSLSQFSELGASHTGELSEGTSTAYARLRFGVSSETFAEITTANGTGVRESSIVSVTSTSTQPIMAQLKSDGGTMSYGRNPTATLWGRL